MNKKMILSLVLGVTSTVAFSGENLEDAFSETKWSGQIRSFYINRNWSGSIGDGIVDRDALALGGYLHMETGKWNRLSLGLGFYTTNAIYTDSNLAAVDGTLFGENKDSYSLLGEAYVKYNGDNSSFKAGRQKLKTPFLGTDDARMLPSLFMAYTFEYSGLENTSIIVSHVNKMAAGTFSNAYPQVGISNGSITAGGALSLASGYGLNNESNRFMNIGNYTSGQYNNGLYLAGAKYKMSDAVTLQAWDYYATDLFNTLYLQADYKSSNDGGFAPFVSGQYIGQSDVGSNDLGKVDSSYFAVKAGATNGTVSAYLAYSTNDSNNNSATNGGVMAPWAGMPAFTQAMATRHQFFADTDSFKVGGRYNFKPMGINLTLDLYHVSFDIGSDNAYVNGVAYTAKESGFDFIFKPESVKNLSLRFRANYVRDFKPGLDWDEYRFILNYNF